MNGKIQDNQTGDSNTLQVPLHRKIAENLTQQVTQGELKPGQKLPSERRIATQFNASRATVRTALQHLEQAGLITRRDRRSAIVAIRRDITPYIRIACSQGKLLNLFRRLGDMQLLPPRSQLQLLDLQQPGVINHLLAQPSSGADVLFCELEYVECLRRQKEIFQGLPNYLSTEAGIQERLRGMCIDEGKSLAIPLSISPLVLYYNRALLGECQIQMPTKIWNWEQMLQSAIRLTGNDRYGFQFRPTFGHLSYLVTRRGGEMYNSKGIIAAKSSPSFLDTVRFVHDLLHKQKVSPLLAKVEQINLFAQRRCGMALDGFEMYGAYSKELADDLGITTLPAQGHGGGITNGIVGLVLAGQDNIQPIEDLFRSLLNSKTQLVLGQMGGGLPVRSDLLEGRALEMIDIPREVSSLFLHEAQEFRCANLPGEMEHKMAVENLFLELWLGLDSLENICRRMQELARE